MERMNAYFYQIASGKSIFTFLKMCFKVPCHKCGKIGWGGCGMHLASVFQGVPESQRCRCRQQAYAPPAMTNTPPVKKSLYSPFEERQSAQLYQRKKVNERIYYPSEDKIVRETNEKKQNQNFNVRNSRNPSIFGRQIRVERNYVNLPSIKRRPHLFNL